MTQERPGPGGFASGLILFGAISMAILGILHFIAGLAAVIDETFYIIVPNYALEIDIVAWGWIHIVAGLCVLAAGFLLLSGNVFARGVTLGVAVLSVIWNFYSIPYYPVWSILMIVMAFGVIWAVATQQER